jgi:hypothetical protein
MLAALTTFSAAAAFGQAPTTVQLPTFSFFGVRTTVSVPDRGRVFMGGVNRAASGRNEFGTPLLPFRNRSIGMDRSASSTWMSVYVHDFEAMDKQLRGQATAAGVSTLQTSRLPARAPQQIALESPSPVKNVWRQPAAAGPAAMSVAQLRVQHQREERARDAEAERWLERAKNAEAAGKANVARVYYQMAARRASGELKDRIAARLESLSASVAASELAQGRP